MGGVRVRSSEYVSAEARDGWRRPRRESGMRVLRVVALMGLSVGLAVAPAYADPHGSAHGLHHGSAVPWIALLLAALVGLGLAVGARGRRNSAIASLALLVGLFGLESAVHSVHHFSDPKAAASCAIFSASQHVSGACPASPDMGPPTRTAEPATLAGAARTRPLPPFSSHEGRAPPALLSA